MPLDDEGFVGLVNESGTFCVHCVDEEKKVKSCEDIFAGGVDFFMGQFDDMDRTAIEKFIRKNMNNLPYWQGNTSECLKGEEATDEEFTGIIKRLQEL
jgi:hypothetical protein